MKPSKQKRILLKFARRKNNFKIAPFGFLLIHYVFFLEGGWLQWISNFINHFPPFTNRVHFSQPVSMVSQPPSLASDLSPVRTATPVIAAVPPQTLLPEPVGGASNVPVPTGLDISIEDQHCHCEVISSDSLQNLRDLDTTGKETLWLACKWFGEWILGWCACVRSLSKIMKSRCDKLRINGTAPDVDSNTSVLALKHSALTDGTTRQFRFPLKCGCENCNPMLSSMLMSQSLLLR